MIKQNNQMKGMQIKLGSVLSAIPLSPNQWTILSLVFAVLGAVMIGTGQMLYGIILFLVSGLLDAVDGAVARARNIQSAFGGFLDGVTDRFVEAVFLMSFLFVQLPTIVLPSYFWITCLIFLGTCMPSFIRAYADHKEVISKKDANNLGGVFERSERIILIVIGLAAGMIISMEWFIYALIAANLFSLVTILQRLSSISKQKQ